MEISLALLKQLLGNLSNLKTIYTGRLDDKMFSEIVGAGPHVTVDWASTTLTIACKFKITGDATEHSASATHNLVHDGQDVIKVDGADVDADDVSLVLVHTAPPQIRYMFHYDKDGVHHTLVLRARG